MNVANAVTIAVGFGCIPLALLLSYLPVRSAASDRRSWMTPLAQIVVSSIAAGRLLVVHPWVGIVVVLAAIFLTPPVLSRAQWKPLVVAVLSGAVASILLRHSLKTAYDFSSTYSDRRFVVVAVGLVGALTLGGAVVACIFRFLSTETKTARAGGLFGGGSAIGVLERLIVFGSVLAHHPEGAGLVVIVKSVARFPEFFGASQQVDAPLDSRAMAEVFIIGTLTSLAIAFGAAYAVLYVVR